MNETLDLGQIIGKIAKLDDIEKLQILDQIRSMLGRNQPEKKYHLTALRGLGKHLWKGAQVDVYK